MVVLTNFPPPGDGVRHKQPNTNVEIDGKDYGTGTLYVSERFVMHSLFIFYYSLKNSVTKKNISINICNNRTKVFADCHCLSSICFKTHICYQRPFQSANTGLHSSNRVNYKNKTKTAPAEPFFFKVKNH